MADDARSPCGCVMLCTDPQGNEIATITDFERSGYGGFTLKEAQRIRCKRQIARAVIDRYASPVIAENMAEYHRDSLLQSLLGKGWRIHEVYIGYGEDQPHHYPSAPADVVQTDRFWLIVREPGMVPERKGPWRQGETAKILREFMAANPTAFIDYLTIGDDGTPDVEHGPLVLQYTDGRSMSVGCKHNARTREAALNTLPVASTLDAETVESTLDQKFDLATRIVEEAGYKPGNPVLYGASWTTALAAIEMLAPPVDRDAGTVAVRIDDLARIRASMCLLQQNSEGCAVNHHGEDFDEHGMPGWLSDTKRHCDELASIIQAALSPGKTGSAGVGETNPDEEETANG